MAVDKKQRRVNSISCFSVSTINHHSFLVYCSCIGMSKRDSPARLLAKDLIAGCFGGVGIAVAGHPFDTIKVNILLYKSMVCVPLRRYDCRPKAAKTLFTKV